MREAQRHPAKPIAHYRDKHRALARGQHHAAKSVDFLAAHGVADHGERLLADGIARDNVIGPL
jgi:hypothetical protein